jgi:peptidoglycan-associated lipoprotein
MKGAAAFVDPKEANEILDVQAAVFRKFRSLTVKITGYTDDREVSSLDESLALGRKRAQAVVDGLVARGVDASRLRVASSGYRAFVFLNHEEKSLAGSRFAWTYPDLPPPEMR